MMPIAARIVITLMLTALAAPAIAQSARPTLVMPFENLHTDPKLYWLSEGSAVLLSELVERYGATAVPREERLDAFDRLQLPTAAALSHATTIKVGQLVGASEVVIGSYQLAEDELTVRARAIGLDTGRMTPAVVERGPLTDFFGIYERAARQLRNASGKAMPAPPGTLLTSPQAFELYVKGLVAEAPATQRTYLEQAITAAPADERIKLALWQTHTDAGNHQLALATAASVAPGSEQSRAARYLMARSHLELEQYEEAFDTLKALQSESRSAEVLNAMGVVQLRRGGAPEAARASYFFNQASQTDPADADYFFNLGYAYWLDKDASAAVYWLREAVRRDPADGDAHFVLAAALQQTGNQAEAARERQLAERLSASWEGASRPAADAVPRGLERLKNSLEQSHGRVDSVVSSAGQRDQQEQAQFHLDAGRRAYAREADREAERELRRALYLSPYMAAGHLLLGRVHLRGGRTADAIQAFKIALWSEQSVEAHVALAEAYLAAQNIDDAEEELARALLLDPRSVEAHALRAKIKGQ